MEDFDLELKQSFLEEAQQGLDDSEKAFLSLEQDKDNPEILDELFRLAHNLKGTSMAVGFDQVGDFTHKMEDLILKLKEGEIEASDDVIGVLLECNDHLRHMIDQLREDVSSTFDHSTLIAKIIDAMNQKASANESSGSQQEAPPAADPVAEEEKWEEAEEFPPSPAPPQAEEVDKNDQYPSIEELLAIAEKQEAAQQQASEPPSSSEAEQLPSEQLPSEQLPSEQLPSEQLPSEQLPSEQLPSEQPPAEKKEPEKQPEVKEKSAPAATAAPKKIQVDESIRVSLNRLEKLNNYVGELVILQNVLNQNRHDPNSTMMTKSLGQLGKLSKEIHEISMSLRMLPMKPTLMKLQRVVRDTSKALDKKVKLVLDGEDTEVDKTVIENLNDPLIHIVRNAIDHGLEPTEKRIAASKSEVGNVNIRCFHQGNNLVIEVVDDGGGIDPQKIRKKAIEKGVLREDEKKSDEDIIQLIFHPGFSTKEQVSEVSGRGVGMDVVKTNINSLNGNVFVKSEVGSGSVFRIELPLTMAIIDGMVSKIGPHKFILPLSQIHETVILTSEKIDFVTGHGEFLNLRGNTLPLYRMNEILNGNTERSENIAIIVNVSGDFFAITVDDIFAQQQVVIKSLGEEVKNSKNFMGTAILGDGMPALIIDLQAIIQTSKRSKVTPPHNGPPLEAA